MGNSKDRKTPGPKVNTKREGRDQLTENLFKGEREREREEAFQFEVILIFLSG